MQNINNLVKNIDIIKDESSYLNLISSICQTPRRGYISNIYNESVGAHMYKMCMMIFIFSKKFKININFQKCILMILIHDLAESYIGDITPKDKISVEKRHALESAIMKKLFMHRDGYVGEVCSILDSLFEEYMEDASDECHFIHFIDKLDFYQEMLRLFDLQQGVQLKALVESVYQGIKKSYMYINNEDIKEYIDSLSVDNQNRVKLHFVQPIHDKANCEFFDCNSILS